MSEENVELICEGIAKWNRGELDAVIQLAATDALLHPFFGWPDDQIYRGREGWRRLIYQWLENFQEIQWDIERMVDREDQVVALVHHRGRHKGTGLPISQPLGVVFGDFRVDGTVGLVRFFLEWDEALEAAGLQE